MSKFRLKPLVASAFFVATGVAMAAGFTPDSGPVVDKLDKALERNHNGRFGEANDWYRRITLSGEINVDGTYSSRGQTGDTRFDEEHSSDIGLADANVYVNARVNDWVTANADLVFEDPGLYGLANQDHIRNRDTLDEAYLTIGNFRQSPVYVLLGREYVPFGHYNRHPITAPVTQLMTQTNATAAQIGVVDASGFNASAFIFRNKAPRFHLSAGTTVTKRQLTNGGAQVGFRQDMGDSGFNLDASWLASMADIDYLQGALDSVTGGLTNEVGFRHRVNGVSLVAQGNVQNFDGQLQYVGAVNRFNSSDVAWGADGARPNAWMGEAGMTFDSMGRDARVSVNYQQTRQAVNFGDAGLPHKRWGAGYTVNLWENTDLAVQYVHDKDYSTDDEGTGRTSNTGVVRVSARFA